MLSSPSPSAGPQCLLGGSFTGISGPGFYIWCPSFCGCTHGMPFGRPALVAGVLASLGPTELWPSEMFLDRSPWQGTAQTADRAPAPHQSFCEGGLFGILALRPEGQASGLVHIWWLTEWISGRQAVDATWLPSLCLASDCWFLSEESLCTPLEPQVFAIASQGHLHISWLWWPVYLQSHRTVYMCTL